MIDRYTLSDAQWFHELLLCHLLDRFIATDEIDPEILARAFADTIEEAREPTSNAWR